MAPLSRAGMVLGLGLGGFFDGIVLHQILGWHHLICITEHCQPTSIEHLQQQNTQDGFFHLAVWILTVIGTVMLFHAARNHSGQPWNGRLFGGSLLAGWGLFNLVEGLIDHQILGIHHVLPGHPQQFLFDMLFLGSGVLLAVIGFAMVKQGSAPRT